MQGAKVTDELRMTDSICNEVFKIGKNGLKCKKYLKMYDEEKSKSSPTLKSI